MFSRYRERILGLWYHGLRPRSATTVAFVVLCTALAALVRAGLGLIYPDLSPFTVFYPSILAAALVAGVEAGVAATLLAAVIGWWAFMPPHFDFFPIKGEHINLALHAASAICMIWIAERFREARQQVDEFSGASAQLASLVTHSPDAIVGIALDGTIQAWNKGAERLFGYAEAEMIGRSTEMLVPANRFKEQEQFIGRAAAGDVVRFDMLGVKKTGEPIDVAISAGPIRSLGHRVIGVSEIIRDITDRKLYERHLALTMRELTHRSKNLLSVIQAMARQTALQTTSFAEFEPRFIGRLQALAYSHDLLVTQGWSGASILDVVQTQLAPFSDASGTRLTYKGPDLVLNPKAAEHLSLTIHELATNALKHGSLSRPEGAVSIDWELDPEDGKDASVFRMHWRERGGPAVAPPTRKGFGHVVIARVAPSALNGHATLDYAPDGFTWTFETAAQDVLVRQYSYEEGVSESDLAASGASAANTPPRKPALNH